MSPRKPVTFMTLPLELQQKVLADTFDDAMKKDILCHLSGTEWNHSRSIASMKGFHVKNGQRNSAAWIRLGGTA